MNHWVSMQSQVLVLYTEFPKNCSTVRKGLRVGGGLV